MSTPSEALPTRAAQPPCARSTTCRIRPACPGSATPCRSTSRMCTSRSRAGPRRYGDFFTISIGGHRLLVIADHKAMGAILRDRPEGFRRTPRFASIAREIGLGARRLRRRGRGLEAAAADGDGRLRPAPPARLLSVAGALLRPARGPLAARCRAGSRDRPAGRPDALHRRCDLGPGLRRRRQHARVRRRHHPAPSRQDLPGDVPPPVRALPHLALVPHARRPRARCERAQGQCGDRRLRRRGAPAPRCRPGAPRRPGQPARGDDRRRRRSRLAASPTARSRATS